MKRSVLFIIMLIGMISFVSITNCGVLSSSSMGTPVASFASYPSAVIGVVIDQNGKVLDVEPGSAAEQAGIARGDVLEDVNNTAVNLEREKVRTTIRESMSDQVLNVKLKRNGNEVFVNVKPSPPTPRPGSPTPTPVPASEDYL
jgi:S1-C subfamily serine protease